MCLLTLLRFRAGHRGGRELVLGGCAMRFERSRSKGCASVEAVFHGREKASFFGSQQSRGALVPRHEERSKAVRIFMMSRSIMLNNSALPPTLSKR